MTQCLACSWWMLPVFGWVVMAAFMAILWVVQTRTLDASAVDVAWAGGIGLLGVVYALMGGGEVHRRELVAVLSGLWALRLAGYLFINRVWGKEEDRRYQKLRRQWGNKAQRNFFLFFQAQGLLTVVFSLAFLPVVLDPRPVWLWTDHLAVVIWLVAVAGESIADLQLARFRADPQHRGKTCNVGLWRYSRHPNYFFEWLHWWTYIVLAIGAAGSWLTWIAPALLFYLLFKVTGIPATEAQALATRGADYAAYQKNTSAFVPWFPKRDI